MVREWSVVVRIGVLVSILALSGCYEPEPKPSITGEESKVTLPPAQTPPAKHQLMGRSVQGKPIMIQILGRGSDTVLVVGVIHGNEPAGAPLVEQLSEHLRRNPNLLDGRCVVLLPVANPDGLAAGTRENIHGIDLNRNFETANRVDNKTNGHSALTEPESQAIQKIVKEYGPSRIVSIHQPLTASEGIDFDGPARALATRMAQYCDLPIKKRVAEPGSLGSYAGEELKIPTITLELAKSATNPSATALWDQYGRSLLAAITYPEHPL
jgi:protein MpaA